VVPLGARLRTVPDTAPEVHAHQRGPVDPPLASAASEGRLTVFNGLNEGPHTRF
jgi:hypothetical protein